MTKVKKRKSGLADKVSKSRKKTKLQQTSLNPFEIKVNRQKHHIFGRKLAKHDKGQPGVSRSKAIKKRKDTLLKEYKESRKSNKFVDKRIGENDAEMSVEDKMMQRFALEKQRSHASSTLYNLESDELTHYGQSLSEIEKFDKPVDSDYDSDNASDRGGLGKEISAELFGGFLEKKEPEKSTQKKSWKERMQEMIANSKKEKMEKQGESDKIKEMTLEVDKQWKHLSLIMASCRRGRDTEDDTESTVDDYDIAVNTMKFDVTATASDRLKTEEELAKEEADKLAKLEEDRQKRMSGILETDNPPTHKSAMRSADDLDDGFNLGETIPASGKAVSFSSLLSGDAESDKDSENSDGSDSDGDNDESDGGDNDGDNSDSDNENGSEEDADSGDDIDIETETNVGNSKFMSTSKDRDEPKSILKKSMAFKAEDKIVNFKERKDMMEGARKEMPFTFNVPETYSEMDLLLDGYDSKLRPEVISRMRRCHHVSLAGENKSKLEKLFAYVVQYICDMAEVNPPEFHLMDELTPHLYHLCQVSPVECAQSMLYQITARQREYSDILSRKAGRGEYPSFDTWILLRLVCLLFPTSDYNHPVVTPSIIFMSQMLAQTNVKTLKDVATGLFICHLCLEYVTFSKRFLPEAINFLHGCLFSAIDKRNYKLNDTVMKVIPPFKPVGPYTNLLLIDTLCDKEEIKEALKISDWLTDNVDDTQLTGNTHKLCLIHTCIQTISAFSSLYTDLPSYTEILEPIHRLLLKLPVHLYPTFLKEQITQLQEGILTQTNRPRKYLLMQKPRPRTLRQFECQVEDKFDGRKKYKGQPENKEQQKLKYLHKKEMKGAIREVKRDSQFLARHELEEVRKRDTKRRKRVKEIYSMLSMQEGEYNKLKREKNWGKK